METIEIVYLLIAVALGGFLAGLLGVGGGIIFVFVFTHFFADTVEDSTELTRWVIANSIFCTFWAGLAATAMNRKLNDFYPKAVLYTAIPGVMSALLVSYTIVAFDWYSKTQFTFVFILMILLFLFKMFFLKTKSPKSNASEIKPYKYGLLGVLSGVISSLSGLGGGVIMIPILNGFMRTSVQKAAAISLGVIPIFALGITIFYFLAFSPSASVPYSFGYIHLPSSSIISAMVVIVSPLGVRMAKKIPAKLIKVMFALLLVIVALKMILNLTEF